MTTTTTNRLDTSSSSILHRFPAAAFHRAVATMFVVLLCCGLCILNAANAQEASDSGKENGPTLAVKWKLLSGAPASGSGYQAEFTFTNTSDVPLKNSGWAFYFNRLPRKIEADSVTGSVLVQRINGDFYRIVPRPGFRSLGKGESAAISYAASNSLLKNSDAPVGGYFVFDGKAGDGKAGDGNDRIDNDVMSSLPHPVEIVCEEVGEEHTARSSLKLLARSAEQRYRENERIAKAALPECPIVPSPAHYHSTDGDNFVISATTPITFNKTARRSALLLKSTLEQLVGKQLHTNESDKPVAGAIHLSVNSESPNESYQLAIDNNGIRISGGAAGVFYGTQSLLALLPVNVWSSPSETITVSGAIVSDSPRFSYRGMHLDVARNFHSKQTILRLLEQMAFYKLNKFHLHFCDDEGWRLEIKGLPELTEVGARRGHTANESDRLFPAYGSGPSVENACGTGHYSREDFVEILKFASERHIEVIPEIDLPGHARAAIVAMKARHRRLVQLGDMKAANEFLLSDPDDKSVYESVQAYTDNVICVGQPGTMRFIAAVVDDLVAMYKQAGAELKTIHIGGDEVPTGVWERSPVCNSYVQSTDEVQSVNELRYDFLRRMHELLRSRNIQLAGWEETGLRITKQDGHESKSPNPEFSKSARMYVWNSVVGWGGEDTGYRLANAGYQTVLCNANHLYFDLAPEIDADVPGYYWAGLVDLKKVFEFTPLDLFRVTRADRNGNPVDRVNGFSKMTRLTDQGAKNIAGIQGQLWSEAVRSPESLERAIFPRLLALSQRAWSPQPAWAADPNAASRDKSIQVAFDSFVRQLGTRELPRLSARGIGYQLPKPGELITNNQLRANSFFENLNIHYTIDGTAPTINSPRYISPVKVTNQPPQLRSFDATTPKK